MSDLLTKAELIDIMVKYGEQRYGQVHVHDYRTAARTALHYMDTKNHDLPRVFQEQLVTVMRRADRLAEIVELAECYMRPTAYGIHSFPDLIKKKEEAIRAIAKAREDGVL